MLLEGFPVNPGFWGLVFRRFWNLGLQFPSEQNFGVVLYFELFNALTKNFCK